MAASLLLQLRIQRVAQAVAQEIEREHGQADRQDREDHLIYWYCDIIDYTYDPTARTYVFTDLLADVLIYPNGEVHVVDLDEIAEATEQKLLTPEQTCSCMRKLDALLKVIYRKELLPSLEPYWTLASRQA